MVPRKTEPESELDPTNPSEKTPLLNPRTSEDKTQGLELTLQHGDLGRTPGSASPWDW